MTQVVPWQFARLAFPQMQNECIRGGCFSLIPGRAVAFFIFCSERYAILEQQRLESTFTQARQNMLIKQNTIRVRDNPQARYIGWEVFNDTVYPSDIRHAAFLPLLPTRNINTALSSGVPCSASCSAAMRVSCSASRRLRLCSLTAGSPMRPIAWYLASKA